MNVEGKVCRKCETWRPLTEYYKQRLARDGLEARCKLCRDEHRRRYYYSIDERGKNLEKLYGFSRDAYNKMLNNQEGFCAICKTFDGRRELDVDHDHNDGFVRGLLCNKCNKAIGAFKDNIEFLEAAIEYLKLSDIRRNKIEQTSSA